MEEGKSFPQFLARTIGKRKTLLRKGKQLRSNKKSAVKTTRFKTKEVFSDKTQKSETPYLNYTSRNIDKHEC